MYPFSLLLAPLSIFLSLTTATGVVVHDTRIDKATMTAIHSAANGDSYQAANSKFINFSSDLHTHAERHTIAANEFKADSPRIQPRHSQERKYLSSKISSTGHYAFGDPLLPLAD